MQWLIINMWMILAAVALFALLFGWSVRGLFSSSQVRRAEIEREIVQTELTQTRAEVEALYQAQRTRKSTETNDAVDTSKIESEMAARDAKIQELEAALAEKQAEVTALEAREPEAENTLLQTAGAAVAGAVAGAVLSDEDKDAKVALENLQDRNAWLETRVAELENDVATAHAAAPAPMPETQDPSLEKLRWQSAYLRQRVDALEASVVAQSAAAPAAAAVEDAPAAPDEDMARLRWRNRYLEGRLAYYEEKSTEISDDAGGADGPVHSLVEPAAASLVSADDQADQQDPVDTNEGLLAAVPSAAEPHPSDAMLAELDDEDVSPPAIDMTQPERQDRPDNGGDDLTTIDGIGPKIAEVLNGLGIWTHAQIAGWTKENEAWIDDHLAFQGRVARENWVMQAQNASN